MLKTSEVQRQTGRIEGLVRKLESAADPDLLTTAQELVRSLMELYGAGLERITEIVFAKGEAGREILDQFGRDELVGNLLAANGLHPLDLEARVRRAVDKLRTKATVESLSVEQGVIGLRLRLRATGSGCGSGAATLKAAVEEAIYEAAPDLVRLEIEGIEETGAASGFVPLEKLVGNGTAHANGAGL
jgi:Fe-S cluster biogenesis protein NfuA